MLPLGDSERHNKSLLFQASHSGDLIPFACDLLKGDHEGQTWPRRHEGMSLKDAKKGFFAFKRRKKTYKEKTKQNKTLLLFHGHC